VAFPELRVGKLGLSDIQIWLPMERYFEVFIFQSISSCLSHHITLHYALPYDVNVVTACASCGHG